MVSRATLGLRCNMTEYTSIRVTEEAKAQAEDAKKEDETWNEYIQRCTANPPPVIEYVQASDVVDAVAQDDTEATTNVTGDDALAEEIAERVIAELQTEGVDESAIVKKTVADIKAELPSLVAEEVRR